MGLDLVELIIEVEEAFGFSIPDYEASRITTVGDLYEYILKHRFQGKSEACLSSVAFYKIRKGMMSTWHIPRKEIRLSSKISSLIPKSHRSAWKDLEKTILLQLPGLTRPISLKILATLAIIGISIMVMIMLSTILNWFSLWPALFAAGATGYLLYKITEPFEINIPSAFSTVEKLTKKVLSANYGKISDECNRSNDKEVWQSLQTIISEFLAIRVIDIKKESHFVKDLGCG
jgi:acyl carrier protein